MRNIFVALLRSVLWGVVAGFATAVLELFGILVYLQVEGKLEGKYLTDGFVPFSFAFYGALGIGLGFMCGLFWVLLSRTSWHSRLKPEQVRAWERGLLVGLFVFIYLSVVANARVFPEIGLYHPLSLLLSLGLLIISVALAFSFESAASILNHRRRIKAAVTLTAALLLALAFGSSMYWQYKFDFRNLVSETLASANLEGKSSSNRPNVFLITIDGLRADHLSAYGHQEVNTENMDRLAREGVLFEQMIAQSSWSRPSLGSTWTSLYPSQHQAVRREVSPGFTIVDQGLRDDVSTVAELFLDAGYVTVGLNTNPNIGASYGFDRGFQLYQYLPGFVSALRFSIISDILERFSSSGLYPSLTLGIRFPFSITSEDLNEYRYAPAKHVSYMANEVIKKLRTVGKPFFLWVHFMDPHLPYYSHDYSQRKVEIAGRASVYTKLSLSDIQELVDSRVHKLYEKVDNLYEGEILYLDHYIGEILNQLQDSNLWSKTLIVLTSNHGEEFAEHRKLSVVNPRGYGYGHTMYDELIRVPLIMKFPDNRHANQRVTSIVQHIDLLPTLLSFANIPVDLSLNTFKGINLLNYLGSDQPFPTRLAVSEYSRFGPEMKSIRSKNHKLIFNMYDQSVEFYDLASDPLEFHNIAYRNEKAYQQMFSTYQMWVEGMYKQVYEKKRNRLIKYIWKDKSFPDSKMPNSIKKNINDNGYSDLNNLERVDKIVVSMEYGLNSIIFHFHPAKRNNRLIVYHEGHRRYFRRGKKTIQFFLGKKVIQFFLDKGYSVMLIQMPFRGMNNHPTVELQPFGKLKLNSHNDLKLLESENFSPIKFFLEPVAVSLNYAERNFGYSSVSMIGISGGAWTTTLYSAIDPRINNSYPVAGSQPLSLMYIRTGRLADYEQSLPQIYHEIANYIDLYVLGSYGQGRKQLQVLNKFDPCCFSGTWHPFYEREVKMILSTLGKESFEVYLDATHKEHKISDNALNLIIKDLESHEKTR